ncbi:MAG: hypothetical protein AAFU85_34545 [Planctomycetota bacterium]
MTTNTSDPYRSPAEVGQETAGAPAKSKLTLILAGAALVLCGLGLGAAVLLRGPVREFGEMRRARPMPRETEIVEELPPMPARVSDESGEGAAENE